MFFGEVRFGFVIATADGMDKTMETAVFARLCKSLGFWVQSLRFSRNGEWVIRDVNLGSCRDPFPPSPRHQMFTRCSSEVCGLLRDSGSFENKGLEA